MSDVEKKITHYVTAYADTLPARLIDNLIRFGYAGTESAAQFEAAVDKFFKLMGYESNCLGQGHGRVADVIAKYKTTPYPRSYGLIIDAKAYARYTFPAGDVRKMKEYIDLHGAELLSERIPNHVTGKKPNVDVLRQIVADQNATPNSVLYIGDSLTKDIFMAKQLGVKSVLFSDPAGMDPGFYEKLVARVKRSI